MHHNSAVDLVQKPACGMGIRGNDGVGMVRAKSRNMRHRFVKAVDNTHGNKGPKFLPQSSSAAARTWLLAAHVWAHRALRNRRPAGRTIGAKWLAAHALSTKGFRRAANAGASHFCIGDNLRAMSRAASPCT